MLRAYDEESDTKRIGEGWRRIVALSLPRTGVNQESRLRTAITCLREVLTLDAVSVRLSADPESGQSEISASTKDEGAQERSMLLRAERLPLGLDEPLGTLECASRREGFPTSSERMLLQLAAYKLTIALQEARAVSLGRHSAIQRSEQRERERVSHELHVGELFALVAHEINQPLAAIVSNANACKRWLTHQPPNAVEATAAAQRIAGDANRASQVVARVRALVRGAEPERKALSASELVHGVAEMVRSQVSACGVQLHVDAVEGLHILGDRAQLEQALLQLLDNSLYALRERPLEARQIWLTAHEHGPHHVELAVSDSGPGMSAEQREQAMTPLYTTKPRSLGLGLSVCRALVQAHEGRLWCDANTPTGESVRFTLPRVHS
jgi:signal transduction histidine kinase